MEGVIGLCSVVCAMAFFDGYDPPISARMVSPPYNLSVASVGLYSTAFNCAYVAVSLPLGYAADKYLKSRAGALRLVMCCGWAIVALGWFVMGPLSHAVEEEPALSTSTTLGHSTLTLVGLSIFGVGLGAALFVQGKPTC